MSFWLKIKSASHMSQFNPHINLISSLTAYTLHGPTCFIVIYRPFVLTAREGFFVDILKKAGEDKYLLQNHGYYTFVYLL